MPQTSPQPPPTLPGPNPLPLHLGLGALIWLSWPLLWQRLQPNSTSSKPVWSSNLQSRAAALAASAAQLPAEQWTQALAQEGNQRFADYLQGIKLYRSQSLPDEAGPAILLQQIGSTRLLDLAPELPAAAPVLLTIPSLVNRAHILDLGVQHGLLRWLAKQGIRPVLVDWGAPTPAEHALTLGDYIARLQQFSLLLQQKMAPATVHLFGHCLGGNLALALAALQPAACRSLILCSTPWDFHAGDPFLGTYAAKIWDQLADHSPQHKLIPPALVQSLFTLLQPMAVTEKFRQLMLHPPSAARLQHFARVEHWLNDGVPLTRPVLQEIILDWYGANLPQRGGWRVQDRLIRPRSIRQPVLVAIPETDHIVPPASSAALARQLPCATTWSVPLGHIGMIVSRRAKARVWRKFADWIVQQKEHA